jgi:replicative DNA helicase
MITYKQKYKKSISKLELEKELLSASITPQIYSENLNMKAEDLIDISLEWIIKEIFEHKKTQVVHEGVNKIVNSINSSDIWEAEKEFYNTTKILSKIKPAENVLVDLNNDIISTTTHYIPIKKILTGYREIDNVVNGFLPGELVVVAARPKVGKTRTLVNLITNIIKQKFNVLAFTLEVPKDQYVGLFYSCLTAIPFVKFKDKNLDKKDCEKIYNIQEKLKTEYGKLIIYDTLRGVSPQFIRNKIEEIEAQFNTTFDVIAIDHATMMKPDRSLGDDWLDQGSIAEELRSIGREKGKVMLTALQIRRGAAAQSQKSKAKADPGDELARSDTWFQTLDVLLALRKPDDNDLATLSTLNVRVQSRHGESASIELMKDFSITALYSIGDPAFKATLTSLLPEDKIGG